MSNILPCISTIGLIVFLYCFFWKQYDSKKYTQLFLVLLLFCGFFLRIYVASDGYLHDWDERYHALVAKNLMQDPLKPTLYETPVLNYDYKNWTANHVWLHKPPLPLWAMALSMYWFGVNEIALRLPSILISTIAIYLTFRIALFFFNHRIAILATFLHTIHGLTLSLTGGRTATDHFDVFFLFFVELAVFFAIKTVETKQLKQNKTKLILMGITIGLAILTKWLPGLIVLPVWLLLNKFYLEKGLLNFVKDFAIVIFCILIFVIPWQVYIYTNFPLEAAWESAYNTKHLFETLEGHEHPFYFHFEKLGRVYGELIFIPLIWWIWGNYKSIKTKRYWNQLAISCWLFFPLIFFTIAETKLQAYLLFTAPAIFIITASCFDHLRLLSSSNIYFKRFIYLIAILLIALPIRYSIEKINPFSQKYLEPEWVAEIKNYPSQLPVEDTIVVFNVYRPIETMFYCNNIIAYHFKPTVKQIEELKANGYKVFIREKSDEIIFHRL